MTKEKNQPLEEEVLKNEEVMEETAQAEENQQEETAQEEAPAAEQTVEEQLAGLLDEAQQMVREEKDKYLRLSAEFDNYRKRVIKEKADLILNGGEKVITAILPIMDDMERALEQMRKTEDVQAIVEGVELIQKKFMGILEKQGVKPIETKEADFDVEIHEAVAQFPAPTPEMKNKVVDCTLKGYKLNEKVIRHAQVVVGI